MKPGGYRANLSILRYHAGIDPVWAKTQAERIMQRAREDRDIGEGEYQNLVDLMMEEERFRNPYKKKSMDIDQLIPNNFTIEHHSWDDIIKRHPSWDNYRENHPNVRMMLKKRKDGTYNDVMILDEENNPMRLRAVHKVAIAGLAAIIAVKLFCKGK